jgi:hypothetical protein
MIKFWFEWMLAIHQAVWFPFNWFTGLERPSVAMPTEFAPALMSAPVVAKTIEGRTKGTRKTVRMAK